jgi:hypothetical protein
MAGCAGSNASVRREASGRFDEGDFVAHVRFLADPSFGGRMTGTPGNDRAAQYVARQFKDAGLRAGGENGGWYQEFHVDTIRQLGRACRLAFSDDSRVACVGVLGSDFSPMALGGAGSFEGPLVFAGYAAHNRLRGYDDFEGVNVKGAVVLAMLAEPHDRRGRSKWAIGFKWTHLAEEEHKIEEAASRGAEAVLLVAPPDIAGGLEPLYNVLGDGSGKLPGMRISRQFADKLLAAAGSKKSIAQLARTINSSRRPASFAIGGMVRGHVEFAPVTGRNVLGLLPSDVAEDAPVILVAAHYDHLDSYGKLARDSGFGVRPGADDNASGIAALILVARVMAGTTGRNCTFLFASFGAEELKFAGAKYFVNHPTVPPGRIKAVVSIEMVGRIRRGPLMVLGNVLSKPILPGIRSAVAKDRPMKIVCLPVTSKNHWSDQAPFTAAGMPTLFVFGGFTNDYHTKRDTIDEIKGSTGADASAVIFELLRALAEPASAPPQGDEQEQPVQIEEPPGHE